jgi:hypothetical protein
MRHVARVVALLLCWATCAAADQPNFQGRSLEDALRVLQQRGLRIVFTSEIVTPTMRVLAEPRARTSRQQLDELLSPHGLRAVPGPGGVILIVRHQPPAVPRAPRETRSSVRPDSVAPASNAAQHTAEYADRITVWGSPHDSLSRGTSAMTYDGAALRAAGGVLDGDALEAVRAMPRVAAIDDFRSEFSVRGSPFRQIGVVIDGVATKWLQHAVYGRDDAGSLSMLENSALGDATLRAGAYPRRYGDALGAQLELTVKEGSRESSEWRGTVGRTSAAFAGDGPLGAVARGSWAAGVRNSYRSWPMKRLSENDVGFAFADAHAKLVYDLRPTQQFSVTALGGRSTLETVDEPQIGPLANGTNRAALLTVGWQSIFGPRTILRQRAYVVGHELSATAQTGHLASGSSDGVLGYRSEALRSVLGGVLEAGADVSRVSGTRDVGASDATRLRDSFGATWTTQSAYVNFAHDAPGAVSVATGVRASRSTLVRHVAVAPWILGAWRFRTGWTVNASAGVSHQFPDIDAGVGMAGSLDLSPERATTLDVGIEHRFSNGPRWQATLFSRVENDVLRAPELQPRLVQGVILEPPHAAPYRNALRGRTRGVEFLVARESGSRFSGWMSYTYAVARQTDPETAESYWSDGDQRDAVNVAGMFHITQRSSVGVVLRGASGVPVPGYFDLRHGTRVVGERRNETRLRPYVRLDAHMERTLVSSRHRVMLFGEVLNLLNRSNQGIAQGFVQPTTGEAVGFVRPLMFRRASIGIEIALGSQPH